MFGGWLVKTRRWSEDPFAHLSRQNAAVDVRRARRALYVDELARLIAAAESSGRDYRYMSGLDRGMLYRVASMTGLRASELASLTPASFDLTAETPTVTVEASCSKHHRKDVLRVHPDLASRLRAWLAERAARENEQRVVLSLPNAKIATQERLWPGKWPGRASEIVQADLAEAKPKWLSE